MPVQSWITLVVGVAGFVGVIVSMVQRTYADRRAEWWRRATWAVDHTLSDNPEARLVAFDVLTKLQVSSPITKTEADLFGEWGRQSLSSIQADKAATTADTDDQEEAR